MIRFPSLNLIKKRGAVSMTTHSVGTSQRVGGGKLRPGSEGSGQKPEGGRQDTNCRGSKGTTVWVFRKPIRLVELLETMYRGLSRFVENTVIWEIKCMICKLNAYVVGSEIQGETYVGNRAGTARSVTFKRRLWDWAGGISWLSGTWGGLSAYLVLPFERTAWRSVERAWGSSLWE